MEFPAEYIALAKKLAKKFTGLEGWEAKCAVVNKHISHKTWERRKITHESYSTAFPLFISPCGKFLLKYGYLSYKHHGVPHDYLIPTFFSEEVMGGGDQHQWILQPVADVSPEAVEEAMDHFENLEFDVNVGWDLHDGNVAMYEGRAVLIDF